MPAHAPPEGIQERESRDWVSLGTGKPGGGERIYQAGFSREIAASLEVVRAAVVNFEEKCNNAHRKRRKWRGPEFDCLYFNENLVEVRRETDLLPAAAKSLDSGGGASQGSGAVHPPHEHRIYSRHGYNQGDFFYQELMTERWREKKPGARVLEIGQRMLSRDEASKWVREPLKNSFAFTGFTGVFLLSELAPEKTRVEYVYTAETDHWLLDKKISVGKVFDGLERGMRDLWVSIERGADGGTSKAAGGRGGPSTPRGGG
jgi:hypothetical protein